MVVSVVDYSATSGILISIREYVAPFLPPPLLALMKTIDSDKSCAKVLGHEPAMKILAASIILVIIVNILLTACRVRNQSTRLLVDHVASLEESVLSSSEMATSQDKYGDTVILIGPSQSGKTFLFHKLLITADNMEDSVESIPQSVVSLRANVAIISLANDDEPKGTSIRLIDYPGHVQLLSQLGSLLVPAKNNASVTTRILLVIDSTKPVHEAANLIYKYIFSDPNVLKAWQKRQRSEEQDILKVLAVCNRSDEKDARNWRRIKLQLKAELDHLRHLTQQMADKNNMEKGNNSIISVEEASTRKSKEQTIDSMLGETVNLDELGSDIPLEFHFISLSGSSKEDPSFKAIRAFVKNGEILQKSTPVIKQR